MTLKLGFKHFSSPEEIIPTLSLVNQVYPEISAQDFPASIAEMIECNDYKMLAVFDEEKLVGICGYWILRMLYCQRYLQISNLIVDENYRSQGIGSRILDYFEDYAKQMDCDRVVLDSHIDNKKSHDLFERHGFYVRGLHFMKDLK